MPGPFADYWIATPNKVLSTTEQTVATFDAPNVVVGPNIIEGEVLSGSGMFKVASMAIFWQAE
jgi:hypothetical protein